MCDYSQVIERTEKMKRRWMRVIENKERLQMDTQRVLKQKYDSLLKMDKKKRKRVQDEKDDHEVEIEKRKEKMLVIAKRKEFINQEFEKQLKEKDILFKKRMQHIQDQKRRMSAGDFTETSPPPNGNLSPEGGDLSKLMASPAPLQG
jgi:hypothetical protein